MPRKIITAVFAGSLNVGILTVVLECFGSAPLPLRQLFTGVANGLLQLLLQEERRQIFRKIFCDPNIALVQFEQFDLLRRPLTAQDKPDGRFVLFAALIAIEPAQIKFHLTLIGGGELTQLQFDRYEAAQVEMVEEQISV